MNRTVSFIALARLFAPILVLLYGILALLGMFTGYAPAFQRMDPTAIRVEMLLNGLLIIWNALYKGLLVMGVVEVIFCILALRVRAGERSDSVSELMNGDPVAFFWNKLDLWLKLNGIAVSLIGLFAIANLIYTLANLPMQQGVTPLIYVRAVLSGLKGLTVQLAWAAIFFGLGDIIFRLRRAVYRPTQSAA